MVFSSLVFLCVFLPVVLLLDRVMPSVGAKNMLLIVASLVFYSYGEPVLVLLLLLSTFANYGLGLIVGGGSKSRRAVVALAVCANLGFLAVFKYADMLVQTVNTLFGLALPLPNIPLPLGISFYTFQALSYVIDVYRGDVEPQKKYSRILLYISFLPQLVAGPIVKYHDIEREMSERHATLEDTALGLRRFCVGLAKKVLIANTMAGAADALYALSPDAVSAPAAWLAAFAYMLQIYYDFSGYSDMAIGLGRAFGFHFKENFDHPYASVTITEFWRRWHMSLSTWLKEYLYIPLGGNRRGRARAALNRIIVFFLCGLWHGANWTFVVWGLMHGAVLLLENVVPVKRLPRFWGHLYALVLVCVTFVVFRADSLSQAFAMLGAMFGGWDMTRARLIPVVGELTPLFIATALAAIVCAGERAPHALRAVGARSEGASATISYALCALLLFLCMASLSSGTYNPFIYFRF